MSETKPGLPAAIVPAPAHLIDPSEIFILHYRHGSNPNCTKHFVCPGTLHEAHTIGVVHCNLMGFHFHYVAPFLSNLKDDEKRKLRQFGSGVGGTEKADGSESRIS